MSCYGWAWVGIGRCCWLCSGCGYKFEGKCWALLWTLVTGRSLHCKVEQPHANTLHVNNPTFYIEYHPNGSYFCQKKNSWVDIHGTYYITKNGDYIWWFIKTYRFSLEWHKIELKQLLQKWRWLKKFQKKFKQYCQWSCVCIVHYLSDSSVPRNLLRCRKSYLKDLRV
jgi:hypothetical protein